MNTVVRAVWESPYFLHTFFVLTGLSLGCAGAFAKQGKAFASGLGCTLLALSLNVAVTLTPAYSTTTRGAAYDNAPCLRYFLAGVARLDNVFTANPQDVLNIALFMPLGFFATLTFRRPILVAIMASMQSLGIEIIQGVTGTRTCSSSDWAQNTTGALFGVGAAVFVLILLCARRKRRQPPSPSKPEPDRFDKLPLDVLHASDKDYQEEI